MNRPVPSLWPNWRDWVVHLEHFRGGVLDDIPMEYSLSFGHKPVTLNGCAALGCSEKELIGQYAFFFREDNKNIYSCFVLI